MISKGGNILGYYELQDFKKNEELSNMAVLVFYRVASMYRHGKGTSPNDFAALKWFYDATQLGDATAAYIARYMFDNHIGTERDNNIIESKQCSGVVNNGQVDNKEVCKNLGINCNK